MLGDGIRLADHFLDPGVFIRSMATRGHLGGLAEATLQAALVLDAAGKELLFVETVGIEAERGRDRAGRRHRRARPDARFRGLVQALKAGVMEIPDVIAVNKRDHPHARTMLQEVRGVLALAPKREWEPPIVLTEAITEVGVDGLWEAIQSHRAYLEENGRLAERERGKLAAEVFSVASGRAQEHLERTVQGRPGATETARGGGAAGARPAFRRPRDPRAVFRIPSEET